MKIISLITSNFMNIEAIEIVPKDSTIVISGPNGAGKSSLINSIAVALNGKALKAIAEPVRKGADSGEIILDLGDIVVKRKFTNSTSSLVVENSDGLKYRSPQALIDGFRHKVSFDSMHYASLPEKQQKEILLSLIDLPIDLDDLDIQRKEIYDNRTLVNRDIIQLTGQMDGIPGRVGVPDDEISAADVMDEMKKASEQIANNANHRNELDTLIENRARVKLDLDQSNDEIERLQDHAEQTRTTLATIDHTIATMKDLVAELIDPDLEIFKCQISDVEIINAQVREKQERIRLLAHITDTKSKSQALTDELTNIDELKDSIIRNANMPVPGLGFTENGVTFEGIPLSQRSDGEKRKISARIGMALNPDLRVLWLKDASLLDDGSMQDMKDLAEEHGYQLWMEVVNDTENVAIHIKDGQVVD